MWEIGVGIGDALFYLALVINGSLLYSVDVAAASDALELFLGGSNSNEVLRIA